jgi:predicted peptidase
VVSPRLLALFVALLLPCSLLAAPASFEKRSYDTGRGGALPYRLFVPENYDRARAYPLVLWLHGGGGRGRDNEKQMTEGNTLGATTWTTPANQARFPTFVLIPQCPEQQMWTTLRPTVTPTAVLRNVVALVKELQRTYSIDPHRIYVAGQSMGGYGAWALIAEYPDLFAAAVPICGGGDTAEAARMKRVPVWAFHGELDRAVPVERSREMVAALRRAGGRVRYTEYKGADHLVWNLAFGEAELLPWVFAQRRVRQLPRTATR